MSGKVSHLVKRELCGAFNKASSTDLVLCLVDDIEQQKDLLQKGYTGVMYDQQNAQIGFKKPKAPRVK
jgi:hypothetical protein